MSLVNQFGPIGITLMIGVGFAVGTLIASFFLGPSVYSAKKNMPYECGLEPLQEGRKRYSIHFYMVALLFIVFDIELIFLFLWALVLKDLGWYAVVEMGLFFAILLLAYFYIIQKGIFHLGFDYGD